MKNRNKKKLLENTIMLYILTFSSYFFNFVTIPYQTRVLGPEIFGKVGFALAFATYFKLLFDFGFLLSATEDVSKTRDDKDALSKIVSEVNALKMILIFIGLIVFLVIILNFKVFSGDLFLFILYFIYVAIDSFQPDYLYRGLEDMKVITIRNVIIKSIFCVMIFIFLKKPSQYLMIPAFNIISSTIALVLVYYDVFKRIKLNITKVDFLGVKKLFNNSKIFFLSRIASTLYSATNTFILGIVYPSGPTLGYYTSSDKILTAGRSAVSPISDSIYPYMVKNRDFKLIKKILYILMPIITICGIIGFIYARPICGIIFGDEYLDAYVILRYMIPLLFMTLPTYLLGFPTMTPLGLKKEANFSVIFASIYHIVIVFILFVVKKLNVNSICILTITTEFLVLLIRVVYIYRYKKERK